MKTTDFAIMFVAIILPIIIVVYVDVSFVLEAEEQKLYYSNIINSAIDDATYAMKSVENEASNLDYGYSGLVEKRISINPNIAIDTFFESLYDNFEIKGDSISEDYIKGHVPALAVVDYNGVYMYSTDPIYSAEQCRSTDELLGKEKYVEHVLKPKRYFTYTYGVKIETERATLLNGDELKELPNFNNVQLFTVIFSMDDYITVINTDGSMSNFYMEDETLTLVNGRYIANNSRLYVNDVWDFTNIKSDIIKHLKQQKNETISRIVSEEMTYAVNAHNLYSDVDYEFYFPTIGMEEWNQMIENVGIIAFVQGIDIGNKTLDYTAHGVSGLKITDRYYLSEGKGNTLNYYHSTKECPNYNSNFKSIKGYYMTQKDAATLGYYPCPVCNP